MPSGLGNHVEAVDGAVATAVDLGGPDLDVATPQRGPGLGAPDLASPTASNTGADLGPSCLPRINELLTGTSTSGVEEFVEIYNPCPHAVTLGGLKLVYRSAAGTTDLSLVDNLGAGSATLAVGGFLVFTGPGYYASVSNGTLKNGLAAAGGGVALRDTTGQLVDSLGWGTATNIYARGTVADAPKDVARPGHSLARNADGVDSGNNQSDFTVTSTPTPGQPNQIVAP